jgi:hypothetical protein
VLGEQMGCLRCVGRMGHRQAKIAGRFDAGHGRLAAQLGAGINCIILQHLLSKGGNHI